jgi:hypothetical protein
MTGRPEGHLRVGNDAQDFVGRCLRHHVSHIPKPDSKTPRKNRGGNDLPLISLRWKPGG